MLEESYVVVRPRRGDRVPDAPERTFTVFGVERDIEHPAVVRRAHVRLRQRRRELLPSLLVPWGSQVQHHY